MPSSASSLPELQLYCLRPNESSVRLSTLFWTLAAAQGAVIIEATECKKHGMQTGLGTIVGALSGYLLLIHASRARRIAPGGVALALSVHKGRLFVSSGPASSSSLL